MTAVAGSVYLVGAGPGHRELMTVRAAKLLAVADVIVHDRLIPDGALDDARPDAEIHDVGKLPGSPADAQAQINRLLVRLAAEGKSVVRLKGGDPFVFGRGGEEAQALRAAGIPFEAVPGPTAGIAAAAFAGIPVTHRGVSTAVTFITGHDAAGPDADWEALAALPGTLVFYMGVAGLGTIAAGLLAAGRDAWEPAAVISRGTQLGQRTVTAPLCEIAELARRDRIEAPAVVLVGAVVALRDEIAWFPEMLAD